jgi:alkanesulfonate monooxygenase SsuD/methylene tetrahydromethanopterin reductase-like flavin-dependent oxidoreductase (luciferase family)
LQFATGLCRPNNIPAVARRVEELEFDAICRGRTCHVSLRYRERIYLTRRCADRGENGRQRARTQYAQDFDKIVAGYALDGTPEKCRARLRQYIDAGAEFIMLLSGRPDGYLAHNIEFIATEGGAHVRN